MNGVRETLGQMTVAVPGRHNLLNALGAVAVGIELQVPFTRIAAALAEFTGAERRFQVRGERRGVMVVDDYGHHPTEIAAVIAAARPSGRRLLVVFQPHRFTRTRDLLPEFAAALSAADEVVLTDIYAAGEPPIEHVTVDALATVVRAGSTCPLHVVRQLADIPAKVVELARPGRSRHHAGRRLDRRGWRSHPRRARRRSRDRAMTVKAPSERNFRRPSAKGTKRKRLRPRLSWNVVRRGLSVLLLVFGVYQSIAFAFTTPLLRVTRINVHGNVRLSSGEVQALVEDLRGSSILRVDLDGFRQRLVESPWVADVGLRRVLPSTVEIFISERRPVGLCRMGPDLYLVDETGTVIDQFGPQYSEFDLPIIDGLVQPSPNGGSGKGHD